MNTYGRFRMNGSSYEDTHMSLETSAPEQDRTNREPIAYGLDAAEQATGRSKPRIRKAIKGGELVARRDGRRLMIEPDELRRWVRSFPLASNK
jgi:hypothetical protein